MECVPLVMEPESAFYDDPVIVLDFQSLYPSMIIAYNLCFSTCLGKLAHLKMNNLGVSSYSLDLGVLQDLNQILQTPNSVMYVPPEVMCIIVSLKHHCFLRRWIFFLISLSIVVTFSSYI